MYLVDSFEGPKAKAVAEEGVPFGAGFPIEVVLKATKLEVWGSEFNDPGPDFCEFKAFDASGTLIAIKQVSGY